ncbi:MAG: rhodanese-like domain-containing protein [Halothiobacillus sp.]
MKIYSIALISIVAALAAVQPLNADQIPPAKLTQTPPRVVYAPFNLNYISADDLAKNPDAYTIIDTRSTFSYNVLHIRGAQSAPVILPKDEFLAAVRAIIGSSKKPVVFYCIGPVCIMAFKAAVLATQAGIPDVRVFDAGVYAFAHTHPTECVLNGEPMHSADQLISDEEFGAHLLGPDAILAKLNNDPKAVVIDIRAPWQRAGISLFQMRDKNIPLQDEAALAAAIEQAKSDGVALYFVDVKGIQVRALQYFLRAHGVHNYWFVRGGAQAMIDGQ